MNRYRDARLAAEAAKAEAEAEAHVRRARARRAQAAQQREAKAADERAAQRRAAGEARTELARLHARRALLRRFGWKPWRALLNGKRLRTAAALAHRRERLCGAAFGGWLLLVSRAAAARGCKEGVLRICALRLRCRHTQRRGLIRMREMAAVHAERAAGALRAVRAGWLRRILAGWALVARAARDQQAAELLRRELEVVEALRRLHLRVAIAAWVARGERRRLRRAARAYKQQLLSRVDAWLEGMDASANTQGRQGSGRLLPRVPPLP